MATAAAANDMNDEAMDHEKSEMGPGDEHAAMGDSLYDQDTLELIRKTNDELDRINDEREELNHAKGEAITKLKNKGIPIDAFKAARKYCKTEEEKRAGWDLAYQFCRKALGQPMQDDLFEAAARRQVEDHQAGKQH